jgi:RHS repeat-associated protein
VNAGQSATFGISASGSGPFAYQWIYNGSPISGANSASYTVTNSGPANAGAYTVIVTDSLGNPVSTIFTLNVNASVPVAPSWLIATGAIALFLVLASRLARGRECHSRSRNLRLLAFLVAAIGVGGISPKLRAQQMDNPVAYGLSLVPSITVGSGTVTVSVSDGSTQVGLASWTGGAGTSGNAVVASLLPNKDYSCTVGVKGNATGTVVLAPTTPGGVGLVNGISQSPTPVVATYGGILSGWGGSTTFTVRVSAPLGLDLRAGAASSIVADKPIWAVGLGKMRNGISAGEVGFRQADFSNPLFFSQSILYYHTPDPNEVTVVTNVGGSYVVNDALPGGILYQVWSREVLLNIVFLTTTSYKIDVYPSAQVPGTRHLISHDPLRGDIYGLYDVTGSPVATYTISQISGGVDITWQQDGVTWDTSLTKSGSVWTFSDWHVQGTSLNRYITTTYSGTTSAAASQTGPNAAGTGQEAPLSWSKSFANYNGGIELTQKTVGSLTTNYDYYTSTDGSGAFQGMLKSQINSDGSWALYQYNSSGLVQTLLRPWLDSPSGPSSANTGNSAYETFTYDAADNTYLDSHATYASGGTMLSKTTWSYNFSSGSFTDTIGAAHTLMTTTRNDFSNGSTSLATVSQFFRKDDSNTYLRNQPVSVSYPSGRQDSLVYFYGTWDPASQTFTPSATSGNDRLIVAFHGQTTAGSGSSLGTQVSSWSYGSINASLVSIYLVPNLSTFTETVVDTTGRPVFTAENVFTSAGSLNRIGGTLLRYDSLGRVTDQVDIGRTSGASEFKTTNAYQSGLLATVTGPDGIPTSMGYDGLLRMTSKTVGVAGNGSYSQRISQSRYDGADRLAWQGVGSSPSAWTTFTYDSSGRLGEKDEPGPSVTLKTTYAYPDLQTTTTTLPSQAVSTAATYLDGHPKSVTGSAEVPVYYEYSANSSGLLTRTDHLTPTGSTSGQTLGWTEDQQDYLGRQTLHSTPGWGWTSGSSNIVDVSSNYDSSGNLTSRHTAYRSDGTQLLPDHLYNYDVAGRLLQDGLDVDGSGTLGTVSTDRISAYNLTYANSGGWTRVETVTTAPDASAGLTETASKTVTRLTGFSYSGGIWGSTDVTTYDPSGRATEEVESVQPGAQIRTRTRQVGGVSTVAKSTWVNGLLATTVSNSGVQEKYAYDSLGRLQTDQWRFDGTNYNVGKSYTYFGSTGYVNSLTDQGSATTYGYSWGTDGSRTVSTTDALSNTTYTQYNAMGLTWQVWGSGPNPVQIGYDALGRRTSIATWRSGAFTGSTWPSPTGGDSTNWTLDQPTGLVNAKTFADSSHVDFTYTMAGLPATRKWARTLPNTSTRVTTTYSYFDGSSAAGGIRTQELRQIDYNDGTPSVVYTYARSSALASAQDYAGTRNFAYRSSDAKLDHEQLDSFYNSRRITLGYETGASVGRCNKVEVGTSSNPSADFSNTVTYTDTRVTSLDSAPAGCPERVFSYQYVPYSDHIKQVSQTDTGYVWQRTYEPSQDLVQTVTTQSGSTVFAQFAYQYNGVLQASSAAKTGTLFSAYGGGSGIVTKFGYDARSELNSEQTYLGTDPTNTNSPVGGRSLSSVSYDNMGNRTGLTLNGNSASYTPNNLNQYTGRTNPGVVTVTGFADSGAALAVNGQTVASSNQQGGYFAQSLTVDNSAGPNLTPVRVTSGSNLDQTKAALKPNYLAGANETLVPDSDGNLKSDDRWNYTYDGENRLIQMTTSSAALSAGAMNQRLTFSYDYLSRRVEKKTELNEVNGFLGQYFSGSNFQTAHHQQSDPQILCSLGSSFPGAGQAQTNFSTYWSGYVVPPTTGNYQFRFTVDDRFRIWINGQLAQQSWHDQGATAYVTVPVALTAGDHVFIQVEYYQDQGGAYADLEWNVPGLGWQVIPQGDVLSPPLSATGAWRTTADTIFLYDQNNVIEEIQGGAVTRSYTWGLDLSGTDQGAGGTCGLLMINDGGQNYFPIFDNVGNLHGLVRSSDGGLVAAYEYNAFGEVIRQSGSYAGSNPLGWNTKYTDRETGLVYFGRRFFSPSLGRFVNRDPMEEQGGWNLYGCCSNDLINRFDVLGNEEFDPIIFDPVISDPVTAPPVNDVPIQLDPVIVTGSNTDQPPSGGFNPTFPSPIYIGVNPGGRPTSGNSGSSSSGNSGRRQPTAPLNAGTGTPIPSAGQFYNATNLQSRLFSADLSLSGSIFADDLTFYSSNSLGTGLGATVGDGTELRATTWFDRFWASAPIQGIEGFAVQSYQNAESLVNPVQLIQGLTAIPGRVWDNGPLFFIKDMADASTANQQMGALGFGRNLANAVFFEASIIAGGAALPESAAAEGTAFRAINPAYADSTAQSGFFRSGAAGRLGNDGLYANSTVEGAIAEFQYHNPGVDPAVFRVEYPASPALNISPPSGYFEQPLPFTQGANVLTAPSLRAPGTVNMLIREGAVQAGRIR